MTRNSKRDIFIVAGEGRKLDTESDLFKELAADEANLLKQYPRIENDGWRSLIYFRPDTPQEQLAIQTIDRLRALRDALQNPETPAWKAAALGIAYQDLVTILSQGKTDSALGKARREGQPGRQPDEDKLTNRVLGSLKNSGLSWKETVRAMECRVKIMGVYVRPSGKSPRYWYFEDWDKHGQLLSREKFAESTLETQKFPKL